MNEGSVRYDILFDAVVPDKNGHMELRINIEAQAKHNPGYPLLKRAMYYGHRLVSSQKMEVFEGDNYQDLKKIYSIWLCLNPPKSLHNCITRYSMNETAILGNHNDDPASYDLVNVVMVYLGDSTTENYEGIIKFLSRLLSSELTKEEKTKILEEEYSIPVTREIEMEVLNMCNYSELILEKGMEKGMEKAIRSMLGKLSDREIANYLDIDVEIVAKVREREEMVSV